MSGHSCAASDEASLTNASGTPAARSRSSAGSVAGRGTSHFRSISSRAATAAASCVSSTATHALAQICLIDSVTVHAPVIRSRVSAP